MNDHLSPADSVDCLIARQLPRWLLEAPHDQLAQLRAHLSRQQRAQDRAHRLLRSIPALPEFAEPLLVEAVEGLTGRRLDVRRSQLTTVMRIPLPSVSASLPVAYSRHESTQSLLAAALHNFAANEMRAEAFAAGSMLRDEQGRPVALRPERFAALCRTLDIGGQYQARMKSVLSPTGTAAHRVEQVLEEACRSALAADISLARLQGTLDATSCQRLLRVAAPVPVVPSDRTVLKGHELLLLGKRVVGALAIEIFSDDSAQASLEGIVTWIPDDPVRTLTLHPSWRSVSIAMAGRFAVPGYKAFFQRFIAEKDRVEFNRVLDRLQQESDGTAPIELDGRHAAIEGDLFAHLRRRQVEKMLADASVLAVPTDEEDRKARLARLAFYVDAGLDLLGLASFFVPGLGVAMLGIAALQLGEAVYEGYQDWLLGDREAAMEHLFEVAQAVAGNALIAGAPVALARLAQRVAFVDDLTPVLSSSGALRLCDPRLPGYAWQAGQVLEEGERSALLRSARGDLRLQRTRAGADWRVVHPSRAQACSPYVEDNLVGGRRHALEHPHHWQDTGELLRRLDQETTDATDEMAASVLQASGMSAAALRRLHLENAPAPALLRDALARHRLHETFPLLRGEAFEAQVRAAEPALVPGAQVLKRDFPGLTARCANELVEQANQVQLESLLHGQRVPMALAQQARWRLRESRLNRACAGLRQPAACIRDTETLALGLIDTLAPWQQSVRIEVREGSIEGPVRARSTSEQATQVRLIVASEGHYRCLDGQGQPLAGSASAGTLTEALLPQLDELQKTLLGKPGLSAEELAIRLAERASTHREEAARLIGLSPKGGRFRPPVRLGDGRLGYPLSGRGESSREAFRRGLRQLYPTLSDAELEEYLNGLRDRHVDPWNHLHELHRQLADLRTALEAWRLESSGVLQAARRRKVAAAIRRSWRRKPDGRAGGHRLVIEGEHVASLPTLPENVEFSHVQELVLRDMRLTEMPEQFLRRFPNLRVLDLHGNSLTRLPPGIEHLAELIDLRLSGNRISLDAAANQRLAQLTHLHHLDLSGNPLRMQPDLRPMRSLRRISLRGTLLETLPSNLQHRPFIEQVDMRDNRVSRLNPSGTPVARRSLRQLTLHDNPLDSESVREVNEAQGVEQPGSSRQSVARIHAVADDNVRDRWLLGGPSEEYEQRRSLWNRLTAEPGSEDLLRFLADLSDSNEYLRQPRNLRERVWRILRACEGSDEVRQAIFLQASGPRSCSDRLLLVLSDLEVRVLIAEQSAGQTSYQATRTLLRLGRSLYRLDQVDRIAAEHIQRMRTENPNMPVDDIEVVMAYRVNLARPLGLPEQPAYMYFERYSRVFPQHINGARNAVLAGETPQALAKSLASREFWAEHLRARFPERFERMNTSFHERLEALDGWGVVVSEQAYLERVERLAAEREQAERALLLQLTLAELERL